MRMRSVKRSRSRGQQRSRGMKRSRSRGQQRSRGRNRSRSMRGGGECSINDFNVLAGRIMNKADAYEKDVLERAINIIKYKKFQEGLDALS